MARTLNIPISVTALVISIGFAAHGATGGLSFVAGTDQTCISSNSLPDHPTGQFPNPGNPHSMRAQDISICVPSAPEKGEVAQPVTVTGIARNGVLIRPGTADYYDARSPRGHSRDRSSGWNLEAMGASETLGLDANNAHVDYRGLYHYHGMPPALAETGDGTRVGWAADGFEIHYVGTSAKPSWMLKAGTRPTAPGGAYDGTYVEDYEFVAGAGNLDACNGAFTQTGEYVYFATDTYPFYPRCLYGTDITHIR
ncbi:YHYH protein [Roseobacteraceae bacterium S113]